MYLPLGRVSMLAQYFMLVQPSLSLLSYFIAVNVFSGLPHCLGAQVGGVIVNVGFL